MNNTVRISATIVFGFAFLALAPSALAQMQRVDMDNPRAAQGSAPSEFSDDEKLLKLAYGRLALYVKAGNGFNAVQKRTEYNPDDELSAGITNVRSGRITE